MKKIILFFAFCIGTVGTFAQTDALSYQAVIIDNNPTEIPGADVSGNYLSEGEVTLLFTIYDADGDIEYEEYQETITDKFGMVNLIIGQGVVTPVSGGLFNEISWDGTPKQLAVGLSYEAFEFEELSREELLFIPYAYHRNITATGTLDVDGISTLNNELYVMNQSLTTLTGDLNVEGNTNIAGNTTIEQDLTVDGDSYFNTVTVENGSYLNGELIVGGESTFNNTVTVAEGNTTNLTGDLNVDGTSNMNGTFNVNNNSPANLTGTLSVDGTTNLNNTLNVTNGSPANLSGTLDVEGETTLQDQLTVNAESDLNGQVTINASNLPGSQSSYGAYPLRVQGSNQGIAVRVNGSESETKNFMTFYDGNGNIHGSIEGQTLSQLQSSFRFIWDVVMGGLDQGFLVAEGIACSSQFDFFEAGVMVANTAVVGAQWIELTAYYELNVGVQFKSGGADYAEWLERLDPNMQFMPGEVVGVFSGKISKNTANADHLLVISTNPIVLGNSVDQDMASRAEMVAFLGQAPVRCVGKVNEGDYILPSGRNDGMAVAFSPDELPTNRYNEIIGVAWETGNNISTNLVNVAIGLTTNDLAQKVSEVEAELAMLKAEMAQIKALLNGEPLEDLPSTTARTSTAQKTSQSRSAEPMSETEFNEWISEYGYIFTEQMLAYKQFFEEKGVNYRQYPEIALIVDTPLEAIRQMRKGEFLPSVWTNLEQNFMTK